ncbi:MAG: cytochrome b/b6 domain-containing protein [Brevundimonas sp.]|jgi:thiosulfate reductase cytochrome b subunit|uniref:cytochrome b/b6 domain-containing protein n=1 Tax=Brevundimonas sp. TaxID=1871086 RepID=UPI0017E28732|nr:cytochrome b/b6 domain-containing protein [Brevundimonas sp.]MBA4805188.1 cytochrome b/b6 domain-containing protein [Brevundimonas sp.]
MTSPADRTLGAGRTAVYRHPWVVRVTHWVNLVCLVVLLMSGLQILRAHPHLYWGLASTFDDPWLSFPDIPGWATLPSWRDLALGRRWHFFFAWLFVLNGLIYLVWIVVGGRLRRMLEPSREELASFGRSVVEHARLRFPEGEAARHYNVIQKLAYLAVLFGLLPLMLITGLAMSPAMNAALPGLLELLGGRQSARTLHFLAASGLVLFTLVHVALVILSGPVNNLRAMITGWYVIHDRETRP